jgi:hypothetical protein
MSKIFGFTFIRNGIKYDYSFIEAITCLTQICQEVFVAVGDSEDQTLIEVKKIPRVTIIETKWDMNLRQGGLILSEQTNIILAELRKTHGHINDAWGIYLQCDEIFHENEYQSIKNDIEAANKSGADAMSFRYLHFWQSHHQIAVNKKWYPHEIRALKLKTNIESWGDAQGFRNYKKIHESEATVYHYGHVRSAQSYQEKKRDILTLYHQDSALAKYKKREKKFDAQTKCLYFWGSHPALMHERILRLGEKIHSGQKENIYVLNDEEHFILPCEKNIKINKLSSFLDVFKFSLDDLLILRPTWWQKFFFKQNTPAKMSSNLARPWSKEFRLKLLLWQKGFDTD